MKKRIRGTHTHTRSCFYNRQFKTHTFTLRHLRERYLFSDSFEILLERLFQMQRVERLTEFSLLSLKLRQQHLQAWVELTQNKGEEKMSLFHCVLLWKRVGRGVHIEKINIGNLKMAAITSFSANPEQNNNVSLGIFCFVYR